MNTDVSEVEKVTCRKETPNKMIHREYFLIYNRIQIYTLGDDVITLFIFLHGCGLHEHIVTNNMKMQRPEVEKVHAFFTQVEVDMYSMSSCYFFCIIFVLLCLLFCPVTCT